jgi:cell division protein FtsX
VATSVDVGVRYSNRRRAVERLVSAWGQGVSAVEDGDEGPDNPLIVATVVANKRNRTPLSTEEVDAIRTARATGASVTALAGQYRVTRQTIWVKTRRQ